MKKTGLNFFDKLTEEEKAEALQNLNLFQSTLTPIAAADTDGLLAMISQTGAFRQNITAVVTSPPPENVTNVIIVANGSTVRSHDIFEDEIANWGRLNGFVLAIHDYSHFGRVLILLFSSLQQQEAALVTTEPPQEEAAAETMTEFRDEVIPTEEEAEVIEEEEQEQEQDVEDFLTDDQTGDDDEFTNEPLTREPEQEEEEEPETILPDQVEE